MKHLNHLLIIHLYHIEFNQFNNIQSNKDIFIICIKSNFLSIFIINKTRKESKCGDFGCDCSDFLATQNHYIPSRASKSTFYHIHIISIKYIHIYIFTLNMSSTKDHWTILEYLVVQIVSAKCNLRSQFCPTTTKQSNKLITKGE